MTKEEVVIDLYNKASGHISGGILCAAIAVNAEEAIGEKVTMQEVVEILAKAESEGKVSFK